MATAYSADPFEALKAATCLIESAGKKGTGYLVSANRIVTCLHVVENAKAGQPVKVTFSDRPTSMAFLTELVDASADTAVLDWRTPFPDIAPLRLMLARHRKVVWEGYGFPGLAADMGVPIDGTLDDLNGKDTRRFAAFTLFSRQLAAGTGVPAHGFSGSPITIDGYVVGHLKRILEDPEQARHTAFGTAYAARVEDFVKLLADEQPVDGTPSQPAAMPPVVADGFEALLSAAPRDYPRAAALAAALEKNGRRIFFPTRDVIPDSSFSDSTAAALQKSRAAIVLMSRAWLQESRAEADALLARRAASRFPIVLVLLDDRPDTVPPPWNGIRPIDFSGTTSFSGPRFDRLLYALDGQAVPYEVVAADIATAVEPSTDMMKNIADARRLISIGNPRKALEILPSDSNALDVRGVRALALAKSGRPDEAVEILKRIQAEGKLTAETGGILAGRYRQLFEEGRQKEYLSLSLGVYQHVFQQSRDSYPGINVASLLLQRGSPTEAATVAGEVLEILAKPETKVDHWTHATRAEALLIRGEIPAARAEYERATLVDPELVQDLAVIRKGARRVLRALKRDAFEFDDLFSIPRPVAFVGHGFDLPGQHARFPEKWEGPVRRAIRGVIERREIRIGLASATVGGDTMFIQEILRRGGSVRVVLPCPEGTFLEQFVIRARQYDVRKIFRDRHSDVQVLSDQNPADVWNGFGEQLRDEAVRLSRQFDEQPLLLALSDGKGSFLRSVIDLWRGENYEVEELTLDERLLAT